MRFTRRLFVAGALAAPFVTGRAASASEDTLGPVRNNISAFRTHEWQDHFDALEYVLARLGDAFEAFAVAGKDLDAQLFFEFDDGL